MASLMNLSYRLFMRSVLVIGDKWQSKVYSLPVNGPIHPGCRMKRHFEPSLRVISMSTGAANDWLLRSGTLTELSLTAAGCTLDEGGGGENKAARWRARVQL
jgi:hypothetical protein